MVYIYEPYIKSQNISSQGASLETTSIQRLLDIMTTGYIMPHACPKCCMPVTNGKGPAVRRHEFQANGDYLILSVSCHGGKSIKTDIDMTIRLRIAEDSRDLSSP